MAALRGTQGTKLEGRLGELVKGYKDTPWEEMAGGASPVILADPGPGAFCRTREKKEQCHLGTAVLLLLIYKLSHSRWTWRQCQQPLR